mmetsp:Transcript_5379/g.9423  ORF Transcript_5379/g.9423 Transcript_5379/m.9423 type:complete len:227 (+) Transcript_5379:382-1062(+)
MATLWTYYFLQSQRVPAAVPGDGRGGDLLHAELHRGLPQPGRHLPARPLLPLHLRRPPRPPPEHPGRPGPAALRAPRGAVPHAGGQRVRPADRDRLGRPARGRARARPGGARLPRGAVREHPHGGGPRPALHRGLRPRAPGGDAGELDDARLPGRTDGALARGAHAAVALRLQGRAHAQPGRRAVREQPLLARRGRPQPAMEKAKQKPASNNIPHQVIDSSRKINE